MGPAVARPPGSWKAWLSLAPCPVPGCTAPSSCHLHLGLPRIWVKGEVAQPSKKNGSFRPGIGGQRAAKGQEEEDEREGADPYLAVALRPNTGSI